MRDLFALVAIMLLFALFGCITPGDQNSDNKSGKDSITSIDFLELGFELLKNEDFGGLKTGILFDSISKQYGTSQKMGKPELMAADGEYHQVVEYDKIGLTFDLIVKNDSTKTISSLIIKKPCKLKSKQKIGIGSSIQEVKTAYQKFIDPQNIQEESLIAGSVYGGIFFTFSKGLVSEIFIGAGAE